MKKITHHNSVSREDLPRILRLEFEGLKKPTIDFLKKNLLSLKDTQIQIRFPEREAGIRKGAFSGFPPWEVFLLILTASANLATIANLLYQVLHDKKSSSSSIVFRFDKKQLKISGDFSQRDIEIILNEFSEVPKNDQEIKLLDNARRKELEEELARLQEGLKAYKRLTKPGGWKKSKEAIDKLKYYKSKRKEIEKRVSILKKLLSNKGKVQKLQYGRASLKVRNSASRKKY